MLPIKGSLTGVAWRDGTPQFDVRPFPSDLSLPGVELRPLRRLIWKDMAWSLRVPIFKADKTLQCVVTVDGSDVVLDSPQTRAMFEGLVDEIDSIFTSLLNILSEEST